MRDSVSDSVSTRMLSAMSGIRSQGRLQECTMFECQCSSEDSRRSESSERSYTASSIIIIIVVVVVIIIIRTNVIQRRIDMLSVGDDGVWG